MDTDKNIMFNDNQLVNEIVINNMYTRYVKSILPNDGDSTKTKPKLLVSKIQTAEFLKRLSSKAGIGILPKNCRYVENHNPYLVYVIEDAPMLRTVNVDIRLNGEIEQLKTAGFLEKYGYESFLKNFPNPPYKMQLSFPYVIYVMLFEASSERFVKLYIFYRLHPLGSVDEYLLQTNLLNVGDGSAVCIGDLNLSGIQDINEKVETVINKFWANRFNNDITSQYNYYKEEPLISTFLSWKHHTKVDPMFIFDVKWKRNSYNLKLFIERTCGSRIMNNDQTIVELSNSISSEYVKKGDAITNRFYTLNSIPLFGSDQYGGSLYLEVGCEIEIDDKKYFVYSITQTSKNIMLQLEDEEGNLISQEASSSFLSKVKEYFKKIKQLKSVEYEGLEIVPGTILEYLKGGIRKLKKVDEINKVRDGKIELRSGSKVFILEDGDLKDLKRFDINTTTFKNGLKCILGNSYTLFGNENYPLYPIKNVTLGKLRVDSDYIIYDFNMLPSKKSFSFTDSNFINVIEYNEKNIIRSIPPVFRVGTSVLTNHESSRIKFVIFEDGFGMCDISTNGLNDSLNYNEIDRLGVDIALIKKEIVKDNKFSLKSFDLDIEFSVDDTVVIADYSQPLDYITKIRTIIGFKFENEKFIVVTMSEDNIKLDVPYIDFSAANSSSGSIYGRSPKMKIGLIRKIIPSLGEFKRGIKVVAKVKSIPMFPKKDVNEIVGIITDTGYKPIILCSNGHTIWCDEKVKNIFSFISPKTKKYKTLETTKIDKPVIKYQSGDIIKNQYINLIQCVDYEGRQIIVEEDLLLNLNYQGRKRRLEGLNYYQTIPMPRFNEQSVIRNKVRVTPNYHGWFTLKNNENIFIDMEEI